MRSAVNWALIVFQLFSDRSNMKIFYLFDVIINLFAGDCVIFG